ALAPALRLELSAGPQGGKEPPEEAVVVEDPVEGRVREDGVHGLTELELGEIPHPQLDPRAEAREVLTGARDHRLRGIDAEHLAPRRALGEQAGEAARPAAGVEHRLVAVQREPRHDLAAPLLLWIGKPVV